MNHWKMEDSIKCPGCGKIKEVWRKKHIPPQYWDKRDNIIIIECDECGYEWAIDPTIRVDPIERLKKSIDNFKLE